MDWIPPPDATVGPEVVLLTLFLVVGVPLMACYIVYKFWSKHTETSRPPQEIIRERVLVICPYCGVKAEQGMAFCPGCGGKL